MATTKYRTSITKSRAGHYTVSIREADTYYKRCVFLENLIGDLWRAQEIAKRELAKLTAPTDEQLLAALGPCGK